MAPRKGPPLTNVEAQLPQDLWAIYVQLLDAGDAGLTFEQLSRAIGLHKQSISQKVWRLSDIGYAQKSAERRITSRGAPAPVWVAVRSSKG
jgi:hypothetical protein